MLALHWVPPTQLPPTQLAPFWQNEHALPLSPHCAAVWLAKGTQVLLVQQPAQDMLSHAAVLVQLPFTHAWLPEHALHVRPLLPQTCAVCRAGSTQRFPMQQPVGQVLGVHWATA